MDIFGLIFIQKIDRFSDPYRKLGMKRGEKFVSVVVGRSRIRNLQ
jgi:hypothetical protein